MSSANQAAQEARTKATLETFEALHSISQLLNTGLDKSTLRTCVSMIEAGVNPEALAAVVKELRLEGERQA